MKTILNHKSVAGRKGAILSKITLICVALSFLTVPRAHAQSGGPGTDHGTVTSIDDMLLEIRGGDGIGTRTYKTPDDTQWLNKNGQSIDPSNVVGKKVAVRFQFVYGGMKALSVQLTSGRSNSSVSSRSEGSRSRSYGGSSFAGNWRNPQNGHTLKITVNGDTAVLDHSPGSPDQGTIRGNVIYFEGFGRSNGQLNKAKGSVWVSSDGMRLTLQDALFDSNGDVSETRTLTYYRVQ